MPESINQNSDSDQFFAKEAESIDIDPNVDTVNLDEDDDADATKAEGLNQSSVRQSLPKTYAPVLIGLSGPVRGHRFSIQKHITTVGRGSVCEWRISDGASSRTHFRILYENHIVPDQIPQCWVEDLRSRNGTELNGSKIKSLMALRERDRITLGSSVIGFFIRDDQELRHDHSLYINATQDPLTGLKNRRMLKEYLNYYLNQSVKYGKPLSLILFDIDFFKKINDTYGHDIGDQALCHVAGVFRKNCRDNDLLARWGGEEFAIAMGNVSPDVAFQKAEQLRKEIERTCLNVSNDKTSVRFTISAGGTSYIPGDGYDELFQRADEALFKAKKFGRNQTVFNPPIQE
jgi:two-component system, cell cycle response regulator